MTLLSTIKIIFLFLAVMFSISIILKGFYGLKISSVQVLLCSIGIVGFVTLQFNLWK